jgi:DNA primase
MCAPFLGLWKSFLQYPPGRRYQSPQNMRLITPGCPRWRFRKRSNKQCPSHRPGWVKTTEVPSRREEGKIDYCMINDLPALVWAANLADLELHTFLDRAPAIGRPTALAFDLDPGAPAGIVLCCQVGMWLRAILEGFGLKSFAKTSGSKGLQLLNGEQ